MTFVTVKPRKTHQPPQKQKANYQQHDDVNAPPRIAFGILQVTTSSGIGFKPGVGKERCDRHV